jgi:hypothetical protein
MSVTLSLDPVSQTQIVIWQTNNSESNCPFTHIISPTTEDQHSHAHYKHSIRLTTESNISNCLFNNIFHCPVHLPTSTVRVPCYPRTADLSDPSTPLLNPFKIQPSPNTPQLPAHMSYCNISDRTNTQIEHEGGVLETPSPYTTLTELTWLPSIVSSLSCMSCSTVCRPCKRPAVREIGSSSPVQRCTC